MSTLETRAEPVLEPLYHQASLSQSIAIGRFPIELILDRVSAGLADVSLQFLPDARLVFNAQFQDGIPQGPLLLSDGQIKGLKIVDRDVTIDVLQSGINEFIPKVSVVTATSSTNDIQRAIFHIFNFPDFFSTTDFVVTRQSPKTTTHVRYGRLNLAAGGWKITIAATENVRQNVNALRSRGGWILTHVGEIVREDGSIFGSAQLEDVLRCLHYCLSFATGRWTGVALPIGFDSAGCRCFEQWGVPMAAAGAWRGTSSWFDDRHGEMLSQFFAGFWRLWHQELWTNSLGEAIYWYLGASDRGIGIGVDTGLILAQAALELLAWNHCVRERAMISPAAFKPRGLSAADKFRLLASSLGLPLELPKELTALHSKKGEKWMDAMDAITGVRNTLVHPHADRDLAPHSEYEAWALSMWYLDLIILRLCGYNGSYASRLKPTRWAGQVEPVPWVPGSERESEKEA